MPTPNHDGIEVGHAFSLREKGVGGLADVTA